MGRKKSKSDGNKNLTILAALAALLFLTTSFVASPIEFPRAEPSLSISPLPFKVSDSLVPGLSASSAIVVDPTSGVVIFEKNPDLVASPASTTKIITALVVLENMNLSDVVTVAPINVEPQIMKLVEGEKITVRDLLYGVLVWSANDAAEALANSFPGGRDAFVLEMNKKAKELNMGSTNFTNPSGLPDMNHYSTSQDLARAAHAAMKNEDFARIVATPEITVNSTDERFFHRLVNLNELLGKVPGVMGVKTGWLDDTGGTLVTYTIRDGRPITSVVLGSWDRFGDSKRLIEWTYGNFSWSSPESSVVTKR